MPTVRPSISSLLPFARIRVLPPPLFATAALVPSSESVMKRARLTQPLMEKSTACAAIGAARTPAIATVSAF